VSTLYIVATPIGNLEDITLRALRVLSEVDLILCEDTRVTRKLLSHYNIDTPTLSYHQHSKIKKTEHIIGLLRDGKNLALVSDAGTPGISDPGGKLIEAISQTSQKAGPGPAFVQVLPVPGPSAVVAGASISGFPMEKFLFLGFPPQKKRRKKFFEEIARSQHPVIFYESPYRILKSLVELKDVDSKLKIVVARELTKKFETIYRGDIKEVIEELEKDKIRGEFVVIVGK